MQTKLKSFFILVLGLSWSIGAEASRRSLKTPILTNDGYLSADFSDQAALRDKLFKVLDASSRVTKFIDPYSNIVRFYGDDLSAEFTINSAWLSFLIPHNSLWYSQVSDKFVELHVAAAETLLNVFKSDCTGLVRKTVIGQKTFYMLLPADGLTSEHGYISCAESDLAPQIKAECTVN
jgi:hypothetical protein